eukprot:97909-Chlamydomonas_euryale.AAC.1
MAEMVGMEAVVGMEREVVVVMEMEEEVQVAGVELVELVVGLVAKEAEQEKEGKVVGMAEMVGMEAEVGMEKEVVVVMEMEEEEK